MKNAISWLIALGVLLAGLFLASVCQAGIKEATVKILNGHNGGSGTVVAIESGEDGSAVIATCGHLFAGRIGGTMQVIAHFLTARRAYPGTLARFDKDKDVALVTVPAYDKLDVIPVAEGLNLDAGREYVLAGYPLVGQAPNWQPKYQQKTVKMTDRNLVEGFEFHGIIGIGHGASGGGVIAKFGDEYKLVGVIQAKGQYDRTMVSCDQTTLRDFCTESVKVCCRGRCRQMQMLRSPAGKSKTIIRSPPVPPPAEVPPAPVPAPNVDVAPDPVEVPQPAAPGIAGPIGPAGPPGATGPQGAQGPPGPAGTNGKIWTHPGASAPDQTAAIAALQKQIAALTSQLTALQTQLAGLTSTSGTRGQPPQTQPGVDLGAITKMQNDIAALQKFNSNLTGGGKGNVITVPVAIPKAAK